MNYFLAASPILLLLLLLTVFKWSGKSSGLISWLFSIIIASLFFGLSTNVFWVSQAKGVVFSIYVLLVLWSALFLYNLNNQIGGIKSITQWLKLRIPDRSLLVILIAWSFSGILEGIAGFGLPIAVAAPMLAGLGVPPLLSVVASAIGHTWSVTLGNMGMVFQVLTSISGIEETALYPPTAVLMGLACLLCGLAVAIVLGEFKKWKEVLLIGLVMAVVQYALAAIGLIPLSALGAAVTGLLVGITISRKKIQQEEISYFPKQLTATLISYGLLIVMMVLIFVEGPVKEFLYPLLWRYYFPEVVTRTGFVTEAGYGQTFRWFAYPATLITFAILISMVFFRKYQVTNKDTIYNAMKDTVRAAGPATVGIVSTVGLAMIMDHTGMTMLVAQGLSELTGRLFPIVSPLIGMLGVFATGSNTNSNVLFVSLQKNIAQMISVAPVILVASQTAGGSLGSMIAPAKLIIGCSTVNLQGKEGLVLRKTLPYGLGIGILIGVAGLILTMFWQ
jgi:lactate permease